MDYNEKEQKYTRESGMGFECSLKNDEIEIRQEWESGPAGIILIPDEARDLVQALEGFLKIVKDEA